MKERQNHRKKGCHFIYNPHESVKQSIATPIPLHSFQVQGSVCCNPIIAFDSFLIVASCTLTEHLISVFNISKSKRSSTPDCTFNLSSIQSEYMIATVVSLFAIEIKPHRKEIIVLTSEGTIILLHVQFSHETLGVVRFNLEVTTVIHTGECGSLCIHAFLDQSRKDNINSSTLLNIVTGHRSGTISFHLIEYNSSTVDGLSMMLPIKPMYCGQFDHSTVTALNSFTFISKENNDTDHRYIAVSLSTFSPCETTTKGPVARLAILDYDILLQSLKEKGTGEKLDLDIFCTNPTSSIDLLNNDARMSSDVYRHDANCCMSFIDTAYVNDELYVSSSSSNGLVQTSQVFSRRNNFGWGMLDKRNQLRLPDSIVSMNILQQNGIVRLVCCVEDGSVYLLPLYCCKTSGTEITYDHQEQIIVKYNYPDINVERVKTRNNAYPFINHFTAKIGLIIDGYDAKKVSFKPVFVYCSEMSTVNVFTSDVFDIYQERYIRACIENGLLELIIQKFHSDDCSKLKGTFGLSESLIELIKGKEIEYIIERVISKDDAFNELRELLLTLQEAYT